MNRYYFGAITSPSKYRRPKVLFVVDCDVRCFPVKYWTCGPDPTLPDPTLSLALTQI